MPTPNDPPSKSRSRVGKRASKGSAEVIGSVPGKGVRPRKFMPLGQVASSLAEPAALGASKPRPAELPDTLSPELATLSTSTSLSSDHRWILENKFDGYRILTRIQGTDVRLFTRSGHDWTAKLGHVRDAVMSLGIESGWLDGEVVALNDGGSPDFNRLQNSMDGKRSNEIQYFVFDAPYLGGFDLRAMPLEVRRYRLKAALSRRPNETVALSEAYDIAPARLLDEACARGLEGIVAKRADSPYVSARTQSWLKLKCAQRQEFVVVGFTDRVNHDEEVGALFLGYYDKGTLTFAGAVGTGWGTETGRDLRQRLARYEVSEPSVAASAIPANRLTRRTAASRHWVKPLMVVEVSFAEWTPDGHVRHATFRGIRVDKAGKDVVREIPTGMASALRIDESRYGGIVVSHPDRVIDLASGATKSDLVEYYESVSTWILPHLRGRPASLVRAPQGTSGHLFFQKHVERGIASITQLDPTLWPGHDALLTIDSKAALLAAAQMNTIEFHSWNSRASCIGKPDRMVFDLDPGDGLSWQRLREAALLMKDELRSLSLAGWLKTSGGKGLHIVVPIGARLDYEIVKGFSQAIVQHMARVNPERFVSKAGGTKRVGKVFIDYLRNGHSQTTVVAFSARARQGLGVSMPIAWDELQEITGGAHWTIANGLDRVKRQTLDPWADYWTCKQTLTKAMQLLQSFVDQA